MPISRSKQPSVASIDHTVFAIFLQCTMEFQAHVLSSAGTLIKRGSFFSLFKAMKNSRKIPLSLPYRYIEFRLETETLSTRYAYFYVKAYV